MKAFKTIVSGLTIAACSLARPCRGLGDRIDATTPPRTGMELSPAFTGQVRLSDENYTKHAPPDLPRGGLRLKALQYGSFSSMAKCLKTPEELLRINGDYIQHRKYELLGIVVQEGELWSSTGGLPWL